MASFHAIVNRVQSWSASAHDLVVRPRSGSLDR